MKLTSMATAAAVSILSMSWAGVLHAGLIEWTSGHGDIGIAYEEGQWDLHIHSEGAVIGGVSYLDDEFEAGEVRIRVPEQLQFTRPAGRRWNQVGVSGGSTFWLLPQTEVAGAPFVGISTEEIAPGVFLGNEISLRLSGVTSPSGLGVFSLFQTDFFGEPSFLMSSADGIDAGDVLTLSVDGHFHANLAFSEPGLWAITFEASGDHSFDGIVAKTGTYYFNVVPEPATAALMVVAAGALIRRRSLR